MKKYFIFLLAFAFVFAATACFAGDNASKTASATTTATQGDTVKVDMSGSGCPMMKAQQTDAKGQPAAVCPGMKAMKAGETGASMSSCPMMKGKVDASAASASGISEAKSADPHTGCAMSKNDAATTSAEGIKLEDKGKTATTNEVSVQGSTVVGASTVSASGKVMEAACPDVAGKAQMENFHNAMQPMHEALGQKNYDVMRSSVPKLVEAAGQLRAAQCPMGDKCPPDCKKNFEAKKASLLNAVNEVSAASKGTDNAKFEKAFMTMHEAYINFASTCNMPAVSKAATTATAKEIDTK